MTWTRKSSLALLVAGVSVLGAATVQPELPWQSTPADAAGSDVFVESFDGPESLGRFDFYAGNYTEDNCFETRCRQESNGLNPTSWPGDHDESCGAATTTRTVGPDPHSKMMYWCRGHVMTSIDTEQYAIIGFAPAQSFTGITSVCVDLNRTDLGGGKWANIAIVPESTFTKYPNRNPNRVRDGEGPWRLDYVTPAFSAPNAPGDFNVQDLNGVVSVKYFRGEMQINNGYDVVGSTNDFFVTDDKATRYQHCITDNGDGTLTATRGTPTGVTTLRAPGRFPAGPVRVIFEDDTYNSIKHDGRPGFKTWHWDNVVISSGSPGAVEYPPSVAGQFDSLSPARLLDTRAPRSTIDGQFAGQGRPAAGSVTEVQVVDRGGVAAGARAVSLNVTAVDPASAGFVTVFPCGSPVPLASNLNFRAGETVANAVVTGLGTSGRVCLFSSAAAHLLVDVNGAFPSRSEFRPVAPARLADTRPGAGTVDGASAGVGLRPAGSITEIQVAGRGGVPGGAAAAALNVTVTEPRSGGFATVYPCGRPVPLASNLNYSTSDSVANMVVTELGVGGKACVFTLGATHLVVDVDGWFPAGNSYSGTQPARLLDTRAGASTVDGAMAGAGKVAAGTVVEVPVIGRGGVPQGAGAVALNLTIVEPEGNGFATVFPCGQRVPTASTLNFSTWDVVPNSAISRIGDGGRICVFVLARSHVVVDVLGSFPA